MTFALSGPPFTISWIAASTWLHANTDPSYRGRVTGTASTLNSAATAAFAAIAGAAAETLPPTAVLGGGAAIIQTIAGPVFLSHDPRTADRCETECLVDDRFRDGMATGSANHRIVFHNSCPQSAFQPQERRRLLTIGMSDLIGYARVSPGDQHLDLQLDALRAAGWRVARAKIVESRGELKPIRLRAAATSWKTWQHRSYFRMQLSRRPGAMSSGVPTLGA